MDKFCEPGLVRGRGAAAAALCPCRGGGGGTSSPTRCSSRRGIAPFGAPWGAGPRCPRTERSDNPLAF
eukprot:5846145-Alexandrium_andersonii.AAC.1